MRMARAYIVSALHSDSQFYDREGILIKSTSESKKYSQRAPKRLRVSGAFAGWRWGGRVDGAELLAVAPWWGDGMSQHWHWRAGVVGGGTQQST
jgi:hypothetical protein